jgi:hypothetical protein
MGLNVASSFHSSYHNTWAVSIAAAITKTCNQMHAVHNQGLVLSVSSLHWWAARFDKGDTQQAVVSMATYYYRLFKFNATKVDMLGQNERFHWWWDVQKFHFCCLMFMLAHYQRNLTDGELWIVIFDDDSKRHLRRTVMMWSVSLLKADDRRTQMWSY